MASSQVVVLFDSGDVDSNSAESEFCPRAVDLLTPTGINTRAIIGLPYLLLELLQLTLSSEMQRIGEFRNAPDVIAHVRRTVIAFKRKPSTGKLLDTAEVATAGSSRKMKRWDPRRC